MAELLAAGGSMIDSVILVTVRSRLAGRKFLTPEIRFSKLAPTPDSLRVDVKREVRPLAKEKTWPAAAGCAAWIGAEVIIVMRVVARTL